MRVPRSLGGDGLVFSASGSGVSCTHVQRKQVGPYLTIHKKKKLLKISQEWIKLKSKNY